MADIKIDIGSRIKELRENHDETQKKLAGTIGVSKDTISKIEQGTVNLTVENGIKIAKHYGTSLDWICGLSGDMKNSNKAVMLLLEYMKPTTMNISLRNSHHIPALAINKEFNKLLETIREANKLRKKGIPEKVLSPWIKEETLKFTESITSNTKEEFDEYALLSSKHLVDDEMMRKLEELDDKTDP